MHMTSGSICAEKAKQLEAVFKQQFLTQTHEAYENTTEASYKVPMLIANFMLNMRGRWPFEKSLDTPPSLAMK